VEGYRGGRVCVCGGGGEHAGLNSNARGCPGRLREGRRERNPHLHRSTHRPHPGAHSLSLSLSLSHSLSLTESHSFCRAPLLVTIRRSWNIRLGMCLALCYDAIRDVKGWGLPLVRGSLIVPTFPTPALLILIIDRRFARQFQSPVTPGLRPSTAFPPAQHGPSIFNSSRLIICGEGRGRIAFFVLILRNVLPPLRAPLI
jgi:hypothetical protein